MTLYEYNALSKDEQLAVVYETGYFLLTRWEQQLAVNLYALAGPLLVELYYDPEANAVVWLRSFRSTKPLEPYAAFVELPDGLI